MKKTNIKYHISIMVLCSMIFASMAMIVNTAQAETGAISIDPSNKLAVNLFSGGSSLGAGAAAGSGILSGGTSLFGGAAAANGVLGSSLFGNSNLGSLLALGWLFGGPGWGLGGLWGPGYYGPAALPGYGYSGGSMFSPEMRDTYLLEQMQEKKAGDTDDEDELDEIIKDEIEYDEIID